MPVINSDRKLVVEAEDFEAVGRHRWTKVGDRFIALGVTLEGVLGVGRVRHRNGDVFDWRRENLEPVVAGKTSRYKGVRGRGGQWFAYATVEGVRKERGPFPTEVEAAAVRRGLVQEQRNRT